MMFVSCDWLVIKKWAKEGNKRAKKGMKKLKEIDKLLITTLVGTNLMVVGISVAGEELLGERLSEVEITFLIGIIIFLLAEILPKTLAIRTKEKVVLFLLNFYPKIYALLSPLIFITYNSVYYFFTLWRLPLISKGPRFTKDDLNTLSQKVLSTYESILASKILSITKKTIKEIMIPRNKIFALSSDISRNFLEEIFAKSKYSRIPVYERDLDNIKGIILAKDLYKIKNVKQGIKKCDFLEENTLVREVFHKIKVKENFFAVVRNKEGKTVGIVTREDILEEVFGEIEDEYD
jgi:CBS domain containing-hemolysin-like protein